MERLELWTHSEQRSAPGRQIPRIGGRLPADGPQREQGGRERPGHFPQGPAADEASERQRAGRREGGHDRAGPVHGRRDRSHAGHAVGAVPRAAAGRADAGTRRNRHRADPGLQGPWRRVADSGQRLRTDRSQRRRAMRAHRRSLCPLQAPSRRRSRRSRRSRLRFRTLAS